MSAPSRWIASVALFGALTACGSTVTTASDQSTGTSGGSSVAGIPGLQPEVGTGAGSGPVLAGGTAGVASSPEGATGGVDGPAAGSTVSSGAAGGRHLPTKGKGWDAKNVYIGVAMQKDLSLALQAAGFAGLDTGDPEVTANAIIDDINDRGGVFGRRLVPIFRDISTASTADEEQATCTYFTQDHQVIGVMHWATSVALDTFAACMKKARTPVFTSTAKLTDDTWERDFKPYVYNFPGASYDKVGPLWLNRLEALRHFTGWDTSNGTPGSAPTRIGLVYPDNAMGHRIFGKVKRHLSGRRHAVAAEAAVSPNAEDLPAEISSAILSFRSAGVTHVIIPDGTTQLIFMAEARQQQYRPRYALNSNHLPNVLMAENFPDQMQGVNGIGWMPTADVGQAQDPGPVGPAQLRCAKLLQDRGIDLTGRAAQLASFAACDMFHLPLEAAAWAVGLDPASILAGVAAVGPSFRSAVTFASGFSGTSLHLPGAARDFTWDMACECLRYLNRTNHAMTRPWS